MTNRAIGILLGLIIGLPWLILAQDWFDAGSAPGQGAIANSAALRSEFSAVQANLSAKLPLLDGNEGSVIVVNSGATGIEATAAMSVDGSGVAGHTRWMVYDVDTGRLQRVTVGADNSCGSGFKCLRIGVPSAFFEYWSSPFSANETWGGWGGLQQ
jgi:hypothetical protein